MESIDLDMGEIFDEDGRDDEDIGAVGTLPDLPEGTQDQENEDDNTEVLQRLKDLSKGAAKKVIRRPQPKLDPTRLTGDRGIPILPKIFEKVKFKGKGHEAQDLSAIMRYLEHWAHRLFPKMPFDEVVERVEKLGSKKEVQTCVKKMRLDMPILGDDFAGSDRGEEEEEDKRSGDEDNNRRETVLDDMWDDLLREEDEIRASQATLKATPIATLTATPIDAPASSQPVPSSSGIPQTPITPAQKLSSENPGLTPEQMERIERNKQLARERKMKKMGIYSPAPTQERSPSTAAIQPSPLSQSEGNKTVHSQSSQSSASIENNSSQCPTQTQAKNDSQSDKDNTLETQSDKSGTGTQSSQAECGETLDDKMSEDIEIGTSQNIVSEQDAQDPYTAPSASNQERVIDSEIGTGGSQKQTKERTEAEAKPMDTEDSEEMSEVIERQDFGHAEALRQTQETFVNGTTVDSMEEMSEVIERQDVVNKKVDPMGDAGEDKENVAFKTGKANTLKQKIIEDNQKESQKVKGIDTEEFNDDLNEEELMDVLDQ